MGGQTDRQTDGWYTDNISFCHFRNSTSFHHYGRISAEKKSAGFPGTSAGARRGFSGKTPTPLWGAGCSSERRKQALVTVNVSTTGKTLLAGCILGTNMFLVVHCLENPTWVAPKPLSLFIGKSEHCLSCSGYSKWKALIMFHLPTLGLNRNIWPSSAHADITSINAGLRSTSKYLERWFSWGAAQMNKRNAPRKKFTYFCVRKPYLWHPSREISRIRLPIFKYRFWYLLGW